MKNIKIAARSTPQTHPIAMATGVKASDFVDTACGPGDTLDVKLFGMADVKLFGMADVKLFGMSDVNSFGMADVNLFGMADVNLFGMADVAVDAVE